MQWIPIDESLPGNDRRVLLSFENCPRIVIGWYEVDDMTGSGAFVNEQGYPFVKFDLFVNAWMELPKRYKG